MTKLYITKHAHRKLRYYVEQCETEISGFGKVLEEKRTSGTIFLVVDFEIFDQEVSAAHSTLSEDALAKFLFEKTKAGENLAQWKVWWHSHAKMESYFSNIDTGTMDNTTEFKHMISLVTNHKDQKVARIDVYDPIRFHESMEVVVMEEEDNELKELCKKQITEKVKSWESKTKYRKGNPIDSWFNRKSLGLPVHVDLDEDEEDELRTMGFLPAKSASRDKGKYLTRKKGKKRSLLWDSETSDHKPHSH